MGWICSTKSPKDSGSLKSPLRRGEETSVEDLGVRVGPSLSLVQGHTHGQGDSDTKAGCIPGTEARLLILGH